MGKVTKRAYLSLIALVLLPLTVKSGETPTQCIHCHQSLSERLAKSVIRWKNSSHGRADVGCSQCHGGDPEAARGGPAHAKFAGHPSAVEVAAFCGRCHQEAQSLYEKSGHARMRGTKPANTCVDCHGAHDVGNPPELFRLSEYCGSCHGLEYLPALPSELRNLMESVDRLTTVLKKRSENPPTESDAREVKALQRDVGRLVHSASLQVPVSDVRSWTRRMDQLTGRLRKKTP